MVPLANGTLDLISLSVPIGEFYFLSFSLSTFQLVFFVCLISFSLFFTDCHDALLDTIDRLLCPTNGICYIVAPNRGRSFEKFQQRTKERDLFNFKVTHDFGGTNVVAKAIEKAKEKAVGFIADHHLPMLMELTKKKYQ